MNTKRPLRIAQITNLWESVPPQSKGGLEHMVHYLTEELVKQGHQVSLFATGDSKTSANLQAIWPKAISRDSYSHTIDQATGSLWAVSEAFSHADEFDVIHDHTYFVAAHLTPLINTPVISTIHNPISLEVEFVESFPKEYRYFFDTYQFSHSKELTRVVVSNYQKQQLHKHLSIESTVIHNGLPMDEWQTYSYEPGEYFAYLGYISGNKGVAEAIQAILQTDETLKIAGPIDEHDTASLEYFTEKVEPYIDDQQIQYLGGLDYKEKQTFLANAKGTLMPIQWDEPFGLVAIESLATGTPVIGMSRAALPEIIIEGKTGFLVSSVDEMVEKISKIGSIERKLCRQRVLDHFSAQSMAADYERLYYELSSQHS